MKIVFTIFFYIYGKWHKNCELGEGRQKQRREENERGVRNMGELVT